MGNMVTQKDSRHINITLFYFVFITTLTVIFLFNSGGGLHLYFTFDDTLEKHNTYFPGLENQIISWGQLAALTDRPQKAILLSWNYAPTMLKKAQLSGFKGEVLQLSPSIIKHTIS